VDERKLATYEKRIGSGEEPVGITARESRKPHPCPCSLGGKKFNGGSGWASNEIGVQKKGQIHGGNSPL